MAAAPTDVKWAILRGCNRMMSKRLAGGTYPLVAESPGSDLPLIEESVILTQVAGLAK